MNLLILLTAVTIGALAYFTIMAFLSVSIYRRGMTAIERDEAERAAATSRRGLRERAVGFLTDRGYTGDPLPAVILGAFAYLLAVAGLRALGIGPLLAVTVAVPASAGVGLSLLRTLVQRRRRTFNDQLIGMLAAVAAQLEAGNGVSAALRTVVASQENPLRDELQSALVRSASSDLVTCLREVRDRYPSRSFDMLISALLIDANGSAGIAAALREASTLMQLEKELHQEAVAEISQTRAEFIGIIVIIAGITASVFAGGDQQFRAALLSPLGLIAISLGAANFAWGVKRAMNLIAKARGDR